MPISGNASKTGIRLLFFLLGVFINSLGIVLITKADLGTSQISSISYVLSLKYEALNFGAATFLLNAAFVVAQFALLRSKANIMLWAQLPVSFLLGFFIDLNMEIFSFLHPTSLPFQGLCLGIGCLILGLGIHIEVAPDIVKVPGEGIVYTMAKVFGRNFGEIKVAFDVALVAIALVISQWSFGKIEGIGIGTVASALFVGRIVSAFSTRLSKYERRWFGDGRMKT